MWTVILIVGVPIWLVLGFISILLEWSDLYDMGQYVTRRTVVVSMLFGAGVFLFTFCILVCGKLLYWSYWDQPVWPRRRRLQARQAKS